MSKLWQTDKNLLNSEIEKFTVGIDYILDKLLVKYDCLGSIAHVKMLHKIGILNKDEFIKLKKGLKEIFLKSLDNLFEVNISDEDCHTAIENYLTGKFKNIGKKVHTGRSRNDQILTALRLFEKEKIIEINEKIISTAQTCFNIAKQNEFVPIPGYTHFQRAMPSSIGLLFSSYVESLLDDSRFLFFVYDLINISPLGSAAGYGVNIPIDRELTANLLGFRKVQNNVLYTQNSRGKFELTILHSLLNLFLTINRIANDFMLFNTKEFGFFSLPDEFTTGSSIMAQKKNPDVFELIRGRTNLINGYYNEVNSIIRNLPSGYHRDLQLIKEPLIRGFNLVLESLHVFNLVIGNIIINKNKCLDAMTNELYSADKANEMVMNGISFRDAYKISKEELKDIKIDHVKSLKSKIHTGAPGNLGLNKISLEIKHLQKLNKILRDNYTRIVIELLK
jgi:argininosuccinate lyase